MGLAAHPGPWRGFRERWWRMTNGESPCASERWNSSVISLGASLEAKAVAFYKKATETTPDPEGREGLPLARRLGGRTPEVDGVAGRGSEAALSGRSRISLPCDRIEVESHAAAPGATPGAPRLRKGERRMVTALVLMHVEGDRVDEVAQRLISYPGISEVYSIAGEWDLAAILRVTRNEEVADLVTRRILKTSGVEETETLIAFKAYSRHDLERMFSIGLGDETKP